jgi:hypothetical protein
MRITGFPNLKKRKNGKPLPSQLPDPRHVLIHPEGVEIIAPTDAAQKKRFDVNADIRDRLIDRIIGYVPVSEDYCRRWGSLLNGIIKVELLKLGLPSCYKRNWLPPCEPRFFKCVELAFEQAIEEWPVSTDLAKQKV